ncbi:leucine Rich repeat-containing domain protein [Trichuris suis]|nr:leucine Rich repeat-containing domain protein [Trichuris suis]
MFGHHLNGHTVLRFFFILFGILPTGQVNSWAIKGCRSIENEDFDDQRSSNTTEACYCDPVSQEDDQRRTVIHCLLGSTIETLAGAMEKVKASNAIVWSIQVGEMDFLGTKMPDNFFQKHNVTPEEFSVFSCGTRERFSFSEGSLRGALQSLKKFTVFGCKLTAIPPTVRRLRSLEVLELANDQIDTVRRGELLGLHQLRTLDLSENNMAKLEPGALEGLDKLENLILGPDNAFTHSVLDELKKLPNLRQLKLNKNHVKSLPDGCMEGLGHLEEMDLSGNFLETLSRPMFKGLTSLKNLDLRVNLISKIEDDAFAELTDLQELHLSGNYIANIRSAQFNQLNSLRALHLGWNEFADIENGAFASLPALKDLQLNNNRKLMFIDDGALNGLAELNRLNLSSTKVLTLEPNTFQNTPKLSTLDLSNSDVDVLYEGTLSPLSNLEELYLNKTQLHSLPKGFLDGLSRLRRLDISFNPWQCNDNLTWLIDWIKENGQTVTINRINDTTCHWPASLRGDRLMSLDVSKLRSGPANQPTTTAADPTSDQGTTKTTSGGFFGSILSPSSSSSDSDRPVNQEGALPPPAEQAENGQSSEVGTVIIVVVIILSLLIVITVVVIVTMMRRKKRNAKRENLKNGVHQTDGNCPSAVADGCHMYKSATQYPYRMPCKAYNAVEDGRTQTAGYAQDSYTVTRF